MIKCFFNVVMKEVMLIKNKIQNCSPVSVSQAYLYELLQSVCAFYFDIIEERWCDHRIVWGESLAFFLET